MANTIPPSGTIRRNPPPCPWCGVGVPIFRGIRQQHGDALDGNRVTSWCPGSRQHHAAEPGVGR